MTSNLQLARTLSFGDDEGISDAEILAAAEEFVPRSPREQLTQYDRAVLLAAIELVVRRKRWTMKVLADEMGYTAKSLSNWRRKQGLTYSTAGRVWVMLEAIYAK